MTPRNPYTELLRKANKFAASVQNRKRVSMFTLAGAKNPGQSWSMWDVFQRVSAAEALGWECTIEVNGDDLMIYYREKPINPEWPIGMGRIGG